MQTQTDEVDLRLIRDCFLIPAKGEFAGLQHFSPVSLRCLFEESGMDADA